MYVLMQEEDFMFEPYSLPEMDVLAEDEALLKLSEIETSLTAEIKQLDPPTDPQATPPLQAVLARVMVAKVPPLL